MKNINLTEIGYLGKGRERATYIHPYDSTKVIKIVYNKDEKLNQNEMEYSYLKYLKKKNIPFTHLTNCYGRINTNLGEGFIFDRVCDFNGNTSTSFKEIVRKGIISKEEELNLINELKTYIFKNKILFIDIALSNVFYQEYKKDKYKLVLTDGIGGKRVGFKSKLYQYSNLFTLYKVYKQWGKFLDKYNTVINLGKSEGTRNFD